MKKFTKSLFLTAVMTMTCSVNALEWNGLDLGSFNLEPLVSKYYALFGAVASSVIVNKNIDFIQNNSIKALNGIKYLLTPSIIDTIEYKTKYEYSKIENNPDLYQTIKEDVDKALFKKKAINLYGPAGTGKTTLTGIIAKENDVYAFASISQDELNRIKNMYSFYYTLSDTDVMRSIIQQISKITPTGQRSMIFFDEWGTGTDQTNNNDPELKAYLEACKTITGEMMGDGGKPKLCPNVTFIAANNATSFDDAFARRMELIKIDYPSKEGRINFFKNAQNTISYNSETMAKDELVNIKKPQPTLYRYFRSLLGFNPSETELAENQNNINQHFAENFLVTQPMLTAAQKEHEDIINPLQNDIDTLTTPRTFANTIFPSLQKERCINNSKATNLERKRLAYQKKGYTPTIVTTQGLNNLEKYPKFLNYLESKTNKIKPKNPGQQERTPSVAELTENYLKEAERSEVESIKTIKNGLTTCQNTNHITKETDPKLWQELNNHRKYKAPFVPYLKRDAQDSEISHFAIDKNNRTYTAVYNNPQPIACKPVVTDASSAAIQKFIIPASAPVTFGDIGKRNLSIAVCNGDIKQHKEAERKNAATMIQTRARMMLANKKATSLKTQGSHNE